MTNDDGTTREQARAMPDSGTHATPPLPLEAWLRSGAPGTLALPEVRHPPRAQGRGELANFALCALVVIVLGAFAAHWITGGSGKNPTTNTCLIVCQK